MASTLDTNNFELVVVPPTLFTEQTVEFPVIGSVISPPPPAVLKNFNPGEYGGSGKALFPPSGGFQTPNGGRGGKIQNPVM